MAKILVLDIETAPMEAAVWGMWQQNVSVAMMAKEGYLLCYSAKWLGEDTIMYDDGRIKGGRVPVPADEKRLLKSLIPLLDEADMVLGHNLVKFDMPKIRGRCLVHKMNLPAPYREIDTCKAARKEFGFESNSLEFLCNVLGVASRKSNHAKFPGYSLWSECLKGNEEAWAAMEAYNVIDIKTTEDVYIAIRPYMTQHPNIGIYDSSSEGVKCPKCGSHHLQKRGMAHTNMGEYQRYQCNDCRGWARGRTIENSIAHRKTLLTNAVS
jgi:DNA polymerase elongation subunit (family B)/predicted RNA-binding Zn-ribbon protein involved in translation (DUF1610 family)